MGIASISPSSILTTPLQANPQLKTELPYSLPQMALDVQKNAKAAQTDTITISNQALKMADNKYSLANEIDKRVDGQKIMRQVIEDSSYKENTIHKNLLKAYLFSS